MSKPTRSEGSNAGKSKLKPAPPFDVQNAIPPRYLKKQLKPMRVIMNGEPQSFIRGMPDEN